MSYKDADEFFKKKKEYQSKGYTLKTVEAKVDEELELGETLDVKIVKSYLKPSPKGTLGCDFDL